MVSLKWAISIGTVHFNAHGVHVQGDPLKVPGIGVSPRSPAQRRLVVDVVPRDHVVHPPRQAPPHRERHPHPPRLLQQLQHPPPLLIVGQVRHPQVGRVTDSRVRVISSLDARVEEVPDGRGAAIGVSRAVQVPVASDEHDAVWTRAELCDHLGATYRALSAPLEAFFEALGVEDVFANSRSLQTSRIFQVGEAKIP